MSGELTCWKCGRPLQDQPLPLGRRAECLGCHAELHVCRMCRHFDPAKARPCREPMADEVKDTVRANFCDWFQPRPDAHATAPGGPAGGRAAVEALFGGEATTVPPAGQTRRALDDLFGDGK
ncbi:MAG: hypothetical protein MUC79_04600 [Thiobacillaceae bacterium]|jgi:hypothetical protein|nr:hypothetical protein [Thiobacillaceae bacterium]